ncbi:MAG: rod shape-determining protein MreC [Synergistes sp.]|nr:rod shape-determining protein MreC [Synergistes sp.]
MLTFGRETHPWISGFFAAIAGCIILLLTNTYGDVKFHAAECVSVALSYPEVPATYVRDFIKFGSGWVLERKSLNERVEMLELENRAMAEKLQRANIAVPAPKGAFINANVTLRYPEEWWQSVRIDKGAEDGVTRGAAVLSDGFLVGRVSEVGNRSSWVELITSSAFLLASVVDQTRDLGVIEGDGKGGLKLSYISVERNVRKGMNVYTSLISDRIPPGIPIGEIISLHGEKDGYKVINITAGAHMTQLYSVKVFTGAKITK